MVIKKDNNKGFPNNEHTKEQRKKTKSETNTAKETQSVNKIKQTNKTHANTTTTFKKKTK